MRIDTLIGNHGQRIPLARRNGVTEIHLMVQGHPVRIRHEGDTLTIHDRGEAVPLAAFRIRPGRGDTTISQVELLHP